MNKAETRLNSSLRSRVRRTWEQQFTIAAVAVAVGNSGGGGGVVLGRVVSQLLGKRLFRLVACRDAQCQLVDG